VGGNKEEFATSMIGGSERGRKTADPRERRSDRLEALYLMIEGERGVAMTA